MDAFHAKPFKYPPPLDTAKWVSNMQTMSLRVGNANVVLSFTVHKGLKNTIRHLTTTALISLHVLNMFSHCTKAKFKLAPKKKNFVGIMFMSEVGKEKVLTKEMPFAMYNCEPFYLE